MHRADPCRSISRSSYDMCYCNALQCVAVCCSVLQCVVVGCNGLHWVALGCSGLESVAVPQHLVQLLAQSHEAIFEWMDVYICIMLCMHVRVSVCMYICMDGRMYRCMYVCMHDLARHITWALASRFQYTLAVEFSCPLPPQSHQR